MSVYQPRNLVLCFDGTNNYYDSTNTNVVKLFSMLKKDNNNEQLVYYQAGIGTYAAPGLWAGFQRRVAQTVDDATAWYIDGHVMGGYEFLMQNYTTGDRICLFGFSRGAYTARALAGMLHKVGLLPKDNKEQIGFAYKMYKNAGAENAKLAKGFKEVFCKSVKVEFIGCWDTVSSVGLLWGRHLPFTAGNTSIKCFRHALALDERRTRYQPNLWHRVAPDPAAAQKDPEHASFPWMQPKGNDDSGKRDSLTKSSFVSSFKQASPPTTDVLEVWFAGCHSDIGGGDVPSDAQRSLSNITLRWMVRQVIDAQCGIQFDEKALRQWGIEGGKILRMMSRHKKDKNGPLYGSDASTSEESPTESQEDALDAVQPIYDQLNIKPIWWALEILPLFRAWQDSNRVWHTAFRWNLGRGRTIQTAPPKLHTTVRTRMTELKYTPRANWANKPDAVWVT